jgi:hypothetical protein
MSMSHARTNLVQSASQQPSCLPSFPTAAAAAAGILWHVLTTPMYISQTLLNHYQQAVGSYLCPDKGEDGEAAVVDAATVEGKAPVTAADGPADKDDKNDNENDNGDDDDWEAPPADACEYCQHCYQCVHCCKASSSAGNRFSTAAACPAWLQAAAAVRNSTIAMVHRHSAAYPVQLPLCEALSATAFDCY